MNHRAVQRALFRMQLDPGFAERLRARDGGAVASAGLCGEELALLVGADPAGLTADRDGRRRAQFLRNVTSEFALSLAVGARPAIASEFPSSPEFHAAVAGDESLPLAFARHLEARFADGAALLRALVALEAALARERRARRVARALAPGEVALAPWVFPLVVPSGTLDAAAAIRAALDRGDPPPSGVAVSDAESETLLLRRAPEPEVFRLPGVEVERLSPALARLLRRAVMPFGSAARAEHARAAGVAPADLEEIVAELVAERVLLAC